MSLFFAILITVVTEFSFTIKKIKKCDEGISSSSRSDSCICSLLSEFEYSLKFIPSGFPSSSQCLRIL